MVMPEHNVTLYAVYYYYRSLIYSSGNIDGILGEKENIQTAFYGAPMDLAESTRLKRLGYEMEAWHCENDGKDYPFFYQYIMPDEDVIMTPVWKPVTYVMVFKTGVNSNPNLKIRGQTGGFVIAPNIEEKREGFTFIGWLKYETDLYYPGDEIPVKGQMPGMGISGTAIWL